MPLRGKSEDLSDYGPHGIKFQCQVEENTRVGIRMDEEVQRRIPPGPGENGFKPIQERNTSRKK